MTNYYDASERKEKFFKFSSRNIEPLHDDYFQISVFGRRLERGDVVQTPDVFLVYGKKLHVLESSYLVIPLEVSAEFENVYDELRHLLEAKLSFIINCRPTDKSVMAKIGSYPNCYWKNVFLRFIDGVLYDYSVSYFDCDFSYHSTEKKSLDEDFDNFCSSWSSLLVVVDGNTNWSDSGNSVDKYVYVTTNTLQTPKSLISLKGDERLELHFGIAHEIEEIRRKIEGDCARFKHKHVEQSEDGTCYNFVGVENFLRVSDQGGKKTRFLDSVTKISLSKHDIYETQEKYFNRVIVDVCIALAHFNIANYEIREIINLLPGMRHQKNYRMMRTIFSVNQSIRKVYEKRTQSNKNLCV